jgi:hypothetical protein
MKNVLFFLICFANLASAQIFPTSQLNYPESKIIGDIPVYLQNRLVDISKNGGVPSSELIINQNELTGKNNSSFSIKPNHGFSCFGVGWVSQEINPDLEKYTVSFRTKSQDGKWTEWKEMSAEVGPNETLTQMVWTDAIFTTDATTHKEIELIVNFPVEPSEIKVHLFDGNFKTTEDHLLIKDSISGMEKSTDCPAFPTMITRAQWCGGSAPCTQVNTAYTPTYINPTHVVIHHGASPDTYTSGQTVVQSYYNYHVNTLGWTDIGYNYLVDKSGNFFQGRHNPDIANSDVKGAHAGNANSGSIGINFPGNADVTIATTIQMQRVSEILAWWFDKKGWDPLSSASMQTQAYGVLTLPRINGHRDVGQTACPGNDLYGRLVNLKNDAKQIITNCNSCINPTSLLASSVTSSSASLNWGAVQNVVSYTIQYKASNSTSWITTTATTNSKSIIGLSSSTTYQFKVMSNCGATSSTYSDIQTFTTLAPPPVYITLGTGTTAYSGHPYSSSYMDERSQYIITKSDLLASGWSTLTPVLHSIAFQVSTPSSTTLNSFTIRIAHTSSASYTNGNFISGTSTVTTYTGSITTINGWNTYTFSTPFNYNQTMNLLITVSFNNNAVGTNSIVQSTILSTYKSLFKRDNLTTSTIASTALGTQSYYRPNMRFKFGPSMVSGVTAMQVQNEEEDYAQILEKKSVVVYPNPMGLTKRITFTFDQTSNQPHQVLIFDQMGRVVYSSENVLLNDFENSIELDKELQQGNYLLRIQNNETLINERFTVSGD